MEPEDGNNPGAADERPEWLPDNFKTPEDLAKSYAEAEQKIREQGAQLNAMNDNFATLSEQLEELQASQQQPQQQAGQQTPWEEMYAENPFGTSVLLTQQMLAAEMGKLRQEIAQQQKPGHDAQDELIAAVAENAVRAKFDDYDQLAEQIKEEVGNNPFLSQEQFWANPSLAASAIEQAYTIVKGRAVLNGDLPTSLRDEKLAAQTITGAQGGRPDPVAAEKEAWDRVKAAGANDYTSLMTPRT